MSLMNSNRLTVPAVAVMLMLASNAVAHDAVTIDEFARQAGWDFDDPVTLEHVAPNLAVVFGVGGNIGVSIGEQGVLIVDDQFPQTIGNVKQAIVDAGGSEKIDFAINTHWHFDHADGNPVLGAEGTWLVSHAASRRMMVSEQLVDLAILSLTQAPYPAEGLPVITFDRTMQFHFNGEKIEILHFGPAHTTGDAAVIFRGSNAVHMGDVFNNSGYPFIDVHNGGDLDGMIRFCAKVLSKIEPDTKVIPGHGPVVGVEVLEAYVEMLKITRKRISRMIDAGMSLEQVVEAKPTADYDERYGDPTIYVNRSYASLARKGS